MLFIMIKKTQIKDSSAKKYFDETYAHREYSLSVFVQYVLLLLENLTRENKSCIFKVHTPC